MNPLRRPSLIALGFAIGLCASLSAGAEDENYRTAGIKLSHQIAKDSVSYDDLCATMASIGIDFPVLLQRALDGEGAATRLLIWAGENAGLDGAASEGYSYTMVKVAKKIGDDKLAAAIEGLKIPSLAKTRMFFEFEFRSDDDEVIATKEINELFPKSWRLITKRVEPIGADQSAAAANPKTEDNEKPKPESDGRSQ